MKFSKVRIITVKDFMTFRHHRIIIYSLAAFEIFVAIGLPLVLRYAGSRTGGIPATMLTNLMNAFSFWFVIGAAILPLSIASYSLVGEKIQKSLEPLLAAPVTDDEILAGKSLAAFIPAMASTYVGAVIFMYLMDRVTYHTLSYYYFPNGNIAIILLILSPLSCILSIGVNTLVSSRISDVRSAQQLGALIIIPMALVYVLSEIGIFSLNSTNLLIMAGILLVADIVLLYFVRSLFQREKILTEWK